MKAVLVTLVIALCLAASAQAKSLDNYGTTPAQHEKSVQLVFRFFGTGWEGREMVRCMDRESGGNPLAVNWRGLAFGLLQMTSIHRWRGESMRAFQTRMWNPITHLTAAKRLYDASKRAYGNGFHPWGGGC